MALLFPRSTVSLCRCYDSVSVFFVCEGRGTFGALVEALCVCIYIYILLVFWACIRLFVVNVETAFFSRTDAFISHVYCSLLIRRCCTCLCASVCLTLSRVFLFFAWFRFCQCLYFHSCAIVCGGGVVRLVGVPWGTYSIHHTIRANKEITTNWITKEKL